MAPKRRAPKSKKRLWCLCRSGDKGWMIKCDAADCPIQWFHFRCVNLAAKPKGKWHCQTCKPKMVSSGKRNVARKSTSDGSGSSMVAHEEFSFYGAAAEPMDVSAIWTRIKMNGTEMTLSALQVATMMDLDPRVRVRDCRKRRSKAKERRPNRASTWMSNGLSKLSSAGKSLLGNLWGKKSVPTASASSSATPTASGSSSAAVRPRPHFQCRYSGCGRRFAKASRLAEHGHSHRRERAAAPVERLPTPDIEIVASQLVEDELQRCPPVHQEEHAESDDEDEEDPISRLCAVAAERRRDRGRKS